MLCSAVLIAAALGACAGEAPPCPFDGEVEMAPSAGCLAVVHGRMLVAEGWHGKVSPPGGHAKAGESAQCAAHRETWEETGLDLLPGERVATFDTGFNLYYCSIHPGSGELSPQDRGEIDRAYWLPLADFGTVRWRYPGQGRALLQLIQSSEPAALSR